MKQIYIKLFLTIILSLSLYSKDLEKVSLRLDWLHQFQFAGYYMAKEKGFFKEVGLDVDIKEFDYKIDQVQEVINQEVDYAVGKSSLIIDKLNGKNILTLAAIYQTSPMILLTTNLSIKRPQDLYNRNIMLTSDAKTSVAISSMITSKGISLNDINFQEHSFNLDDLISGKTDAMGSYISNEPFILKNKNIKYNILDPKDYGFDFYGGILFTSKFEVDKHPQRVQNFQKAALKGWSYAFNNIHETIEVIMNKYNTQKKSFSALEYEALTLKELSQIDKGKLGEINYKKLNEIKKIYSLLGYVDMKQELSNFIIFPKDVLLSEKEKEYLKEITVKYLSTLNPPFNNGLGNSSIEYDYINLLKNKIPMDVKIRNEDSPSLLLKSLMNTPTQIKIVSTLDDYNQTNVLKTNPITKYSLAIVSKLNTSFISSTSMLNNKKVAIRGDNILNEKIMKAYSNITFVQTKTLDDALKLLEEGKVYAVLEILPLLNYKIKELEIKDIKIVGTTEFFYELSYMLNSKDTILHSILNKAIERINIEDIEKIDFIYNKLDYHESSNSELFYKIAFFSTLLIIFLIVLNIKLSKEIKKRKDAEKRLSSLSHTDELTGLNNKRKIIKILINKIVLSKRYARPLSIIFFNIDNFKKVNSLHGHTIGDEVLKELIDLINKNIRTSDILGRMDGDNFLLLLPETSKENAKRTAENLKDIIASFKFKIGINITCSFGVSSLEENDTKKSLLKKAEDAMFEVKSDLKNDVKVD